MTFDRSFRRRFTSVGQRRWFTLLAVAALGATALLAAAQREAARPTPAQSPPLEALTAACRTDNPYIVSPCFARGTEWDEPALVAYRDTPDNSDHHVLARHRDIGATYGVAIEPEGSSLFVSAYHKRGTPFGPLGPGGIYRLDLETGAIEQWTTVPDVGTDRHERRGNYFPDTRARDVTGVTGLGDLDVSEDGEQLYVMNMLRREIMHYEVATKRLVSRIDVGSEAEDWARDGRPFGLKVWRGELYHGVVHSAQSSQDRDDLAAYVYASDLDGSNMREVVRVSMDYERGMALRFGFFNVPARWQVWRNGWNTIAGGGAFGQGIGYYPQPMLSDIEFSDSGDMILGLRDRFGDMTFFSPGNENPPGEGTGTPAGDILIGRPSGDGRWEVSTTPEFYAQDAGPGLGSTQSTHDETSFGGLARVLVADIVVTTGLAPEAISSGGAYWFDNRTGRNTAREELYRFSDDLVNFGKANGLGDVEVLCPAEIVTPTPTPSATSRATPSSTSTPTPRATLTPTITPSPTATPTPHIIYLPYGENECIPEKRFVDVVLVLDRSTSMLRSVEEGGLQKNEAAIAAARTFIAQLALEPDVNDPLLRHDQVAIVGFNNDAWVEIPLTNDRAAAEAALESIRTKTKEGTRLDLALLEGQKPLDGPERIRANNAVLVLLTDGLPNRVPFGAGSTSPTCSSQECTVEAAADAVKAAGTNVYAIALGRPNDIGPLLMLQIVSERYQYYYAPLPEDLEAIYKIILDTFTFCGRKNVPPPTPCVPQYQHADLILVLDTSTSMQRETRAGRTKLEAALEAAGTFADSLSLERDGYGRQDRLAIVGFNNTAWTELTLSDDRTRIDQALAALPAKSAEGTRLDLAFQQGIAAWTDSWRLPANRPVLVLLTDGLPNRVPFGPGSAYPECSSQECTVLKAATAAKEAGARVFTIGLGLPDDVLRRLLEEAASSPRDYAFAPDAEDLASIYRQIAGRVRACP
jgi:Mg-chelatase subunit ChlD